MLFAGLGWGFCSSAFAFPPAPYYTLYGLVRDQTGTVLATEGAELILMRDGEEVGRAPVSAVMAESNYQLDVRLDAGRASTRLYTDQAIAAQGQFSIAVSLGGQLYYPIEVAGTLRAGNGGERIRLDLTLGEDSDRDGLPDAWEYWQLYQMGEYPGSPGWNLARVTRDGDLDGDGVSNYQEYIAGTFAGDATERFELAIKSRSDDRVSFEFFAITGKIYNIEESTDLVTWKTIPFSVTENGTAANYFRSPDVAVTPAYAKPAPGGRNFYRLSVR